MKKPIFTGAGVAIITPFTSDGKVNYPALKEILEYQIANSTDCIVICGTTGESATLSHEEHTEVIKYAVDVVAGRIPVVAGTGSNDTAYALNLSNEAEKAGVDGLLMVTPYYNKASQEGLIKHFTYVAVSPHRLFCTMYRVEPVVKLNRKLMPNSQSIKTFMLLKRLQEICLQ